MTGEGTVISSEQGKAIVEISKSSACGHDCKSCGACNNPTYLIEVADPLGAAKGDRVIIQSDTKAVLGLSFTLYMLPVILMIIAALLCEALELGVYSAVVFVMLALMWFSVIRRREKLPKPKNTISKIINRKAKEYEED